MTFSHPVRTSALAAALLAAPLPLAAAGCGSGGAGPSPSGPASAASASASAPAKPPPGIVAGVPLSPEKIAAVVNKAREEPYSGPTGTLRGTIKITGDPPPELSLKLPKGACRGEAAATHGKLFRTGQDGALADALVAVTRYRGYVPPAAEAVKLTIRNCSFEKRTVAAMFGQRIEVSNRDALESYMPYLHGGITKAILVAIPGGDPVRLYPQLPGHYLIRDQLPNEHLTADVYVLPYATHAVTGLDGRYEIKGIPVGEVKVDAMLPSINKSKGDNIKIEPGDNTLDLTLTFDAAKDKPTKGTTGDPPRVVPDDAASSSQPK